MTDNLLQASDQDGPVLDQNTDYLEELTKPGAKFDKTKYKTELEAYREIAKGKVYADQLIEVKNKRDDEMRADYLRLREDNMAKAKLEELIDQLKKERLTSSENTLNANEGIKQPTIDAKEIDSLFDSKLQRYELAKKETENFNLVKSKLTDRFGTNYQNTVKQHIDSMGLSVEDFNALAKKSPEALFRTLGIDETRKQEGFQAPTVTSQRTDITSPKFTNHKPWSYYQELKKKDPMAWLDTKTAVQMSKDATALGDAFRDGDYYVKGLHDD